MLFQTPTLSPTHIAFFYAGYVWLVGREGGEARRLTGEGGEESAPFFSPDGAHLAFSKQSGGNLDVYVVGAAGGELRRLTYHPKEDTAAGWTPDGGRVLFRSARASAAYNRLYTVPVRGGFETELPLPMAEEGSFSPDSSRLAYVAVRDSTQTWRNHRGGHTTRVWIADLDGGGIEEVPHPDCNDRNPVWVGDTVYFISDRTGTANLFAYDTTSGRVRQLTAFDGEDVKSASAHGRTIAFAQTGSISLYDSESGETVRVPIRVAGDFPQTRPRTVKAARWIRSFGLSPTGSHMVFGARGKVLTLDVESGRTLNLTKSSGVAERSPACSPDGRHIAYFSDAGGEYQLHIRPFDGRGDERRIPVEERPSFYTELVWSPDSNRIALTDKRLTLWCVEVDKALARKVDSSTYAGHGLFRPSWSPDGRHLAYSKHLPNRLRAVFIHSPETGENRRVTDGRGDADFPVFDPGGGRLYFTVSFNAGPSKGFGLSALAFNASLTRSVQMLVLREGGSGDDGADGRETAADGRARAFEIDFEDVGRRTVRLPLAARDYVSLAAGSEGVLFVSERVPAFGTADAKASLTLHRFDLATRKAEKFAEGIDAYTVSHDGGTLAYRRGDEWFVVRSNEPPQTGEGRLDLEALEIRVEPREEWRQIFEEAWRIVRDYFYDPRHHGQNLDALKEQYAAYLPHVVTRQDLSHLLKEMYSRLSVSHMQVRGGDEPAPEGAREQVGLLGADYEVHRGRYRFARVFSGDNSADALRAPLAQPGVRAGAGDYLLAVEGREVRADDNLYRHFTGTAGKSVKLTFGPEPDGAGARTATVVPLSDEGPLRQYDWAEGNRALVDKLSGGRLAYIYLPNVGDSGYEIFNRDFYAQADKQGLIIDERFNSGGWPADYIIDALRRRPLSFYAFREGEDMPFPSGAIPGPRVMIINEHAGSAGDTLPWMFRAAGLGTLVGKRTWGAGIGAFVEIPELLDGGTILAPNRGFYNPREGVWDIENRGVAPDVEVEILPSDWRAGRDPQLETAVRLALEELERDPPPRPRRPAYPEY